MAAVVMHPLTRAETMPRRRRDGSSNQADADAIIRPNDRLSSFERLEIYNRGYWFRLYTSFEEDFPGLKAILGSKKFDGLMRAYLTECPSTSFTLRNLGSRLESWLGEHPQWIEPRALLALDMVRLEWAHIESFDSAVDPVLTPEDFAAVGEETRFHLQPYLRLLQLQYPVDDLLIAVRSENGSSDASSNNASASHHSKAVRQVKTLKPERIFLALNRHQNSVYYKRLHEEDYRLLQSLMTGESLGTAIEIAFAKSTLPDEQRVPFIQEAFQSWASLGWFSKPEKK